MAFLDDEPALGRITADAASDSQTTPGEALADARQFIGDGREGFLTRAFPRRVDDINIHRQPGHIPNEHVDRRPTLHRKAITGEDIRGDAQQ